MRINRMGTSFGESMLEQECHSIPDIFVYGIRTLLLILHSFYKSSFVETDHWHILRSFLILQVSSIRTTSYVPTRSFSIYSDACFTYHRQNSPAAHHAPTHWKSISIGRSTSRCMLGNTHLCFHSYDSSIRTKQNCPPVCR